MNISSINRLKENELGSGLEIIFADAKKITLNSKTLRKNCPCASCQAKRGDSSHDTPLSPKSGRSLLNVISATSDEELDLKQIWMLGNYALGMKWGDGHDSGIYTFEFLKSLDQ